MTVLRLVQGSNADTVEVLEYLLRRAKLGEVIALAVAYKTRKGAEEAVFSGLYRASPDQAISASMRLSWALTGASGRPAP